MRGVLPRLGVVALFAFVLMGCGGGDSPAPSELENPRVRSSILGPMGVAITPDGAFAYVTNRDAGTVSVIETASNAVVATVDLGG